MTVSRRDFLAAAVATSASLALLKDSQAQTSGKRAIIVSASNGFNYLEEAYAFLAGGGDTLDAALKVVKGPEDDPNDTSVGYGGLPNEEGVVELDSCCMHGPTRRAGSVGGVRNIKNVSQVAKAVMTNTGHVMLVGEGAERFAVAMGFPRENLLTDHSRKIWLLWKEYHSGPGWWGPGISDPHWKTPDTKTQSELLQKKLEQRAAELGVAPELCTQAARAVIFPPHGTIHCSALNEKGEISGSTTTSGLAWKLAGRCGDSPIIGAGCYTDQDVGSAGATGNGEENIKVVGAHSIVENMRRGMSPREAGLDVLKRITRNYESNPTKLRYVSMRYYILRRDGEYASVTMWSGSAEHPARFAVHDGTKRLENCVALFQGEPLPFPPQPKD